MGNRRCEAVSLIDRIDTESAHVVALLERCSDVAFAKGTPDLAEFSALCRQIRTIITGGREDYRHMSAASQDETGMGSRLK